MTKKIETRILEGKVKWIKPPGYPPRLEGELFMEFKCQDCYTPNKIKQNLADYDGTSKIFECSFCSQQYLIDIELRNPVTPTVGDRTAVELYKQMIPTLQKARGIKPSDAVNLAK